MRREVPVETHDPLVSVIIPTYRREQQVVDAVRSVLSHGVATVEVVVIDDSPEQTAREAVLAIADDRVHYVAMEVPSRGRPALVRNTGIRHARGAYLYFLDDDDKAVPGGIDRLVTALQRHPRKGVAYGCVECFGPDAAIRDRYNRWFGWAARTSRRVRRSSWLTSGVILFRGTLIINSACMVRRDIALSLGGYDPEIDVYEDVDFFTRAIRQYGHVFVDSPVLHYSTGLQSLIHDLHDDTSLVSSSYDVIHRNYRRRHGTLEYRALQIASKLLPIG
jgi:glycosyltransferase involved in cell wall biosynthesis